MLGYNLSQFSDFFQRLFDTSDWPARWNCGEWSDFHGWLYILSDLAIWLAYFAIPVILIWFIQKKPNVPFTPVFWLFGAFIVLCGTTHVLDAIIFWWPGYRVSALARFITAVVSFVTVFALIRELPRALKFTDPDRTDELKHERAELVESGRKQEELVEKLMKELGQQTDEIAALRAQVNSLRNG